MRDLDGQVLLLGVGHDADTSLHLAELIAKVVALSAAVAKAHRRPFLMEFRRINETNEINETNDLKKRSGMSRDPPPGCHDPGPGGRRETVQIRG